MGKTTTTTTRILSQRMYLFDYFLNSNELGLGGRQRGGRDEDVEYYGIQLIYLVEIFESIF